MGTPPAKKLGHTVAFTRLILKVRGRMLKSGGGYNAASHMANSKRHGTLPWLLLEILLDMDLDDAVHSFKACTLGLGSTLIIVYDYYGKLAVTGDLTHR